MKKLIVLLAAVLLVSACGGNKTAQQTTTEKKEEVKTEVAGANTEANAQTTQKETVNTGTQSSEQKQQTTQENKETTPTTTQQTTAPVVTKTEVKNGATITTKTETIPYKTIDRYASTNAKSRVFQQGVNGTKIITYTNGTKTSEKITAQPKDHIIERYIEVSPRKVTKQRVEDKTRPIYRTISVRRWFVSTSSGELLLFYSEKEAYNKYSDLSDSGVGARWGTYSREQRKTDVVIGYEEIEKEIVQEAKYEWRH